LTTFAARVPAAFARLHRRRDGRLVAGVCSGLARTARVDPTLVRLVFALLALAGGAGVMAYVGAWLALPEDTGASVSRRRRLTGVILMLVAATGALRAVGIADSILWPAFAVAVGVYLVQAKHGPGRRERRRRLLGALFVAGGIIAFAVTVPGIGSQSSLIAPTGLLVAFGLIVGPWIWRLAQERDAERLERIRAQERADLAARVHDSVLQTLTLVQRSAGDAKRVAGLARRQERELRGWLYGDPGRSEGETLRTALEDALADVEEMHGIRVEIVQTGDAPLHESLQALVLAAREAVNNAAVHSGTDDVSVFVQVADAEAAVYVRDRGQGFDPNAPTDRRGIAESIEGRLTRSGGTAVVRSAPGEGTEVELRIPLREERT
jgi:signal transduction histidine kinase